MATHSGHQVHAPAVLWSQVLVTRWEGRILFEGGSAPVTVLRSEALDCSVAEYKSRYADCLHARRFSTTFLNVRITILYDRRGMKRDNNMCGWNRRWRVMQSYCAGFVDPVGLLKMPMGHLRDKSSYVLRLVTSVEYAGTIRRAVCLEASYLDRPFDQ